MEQSFTPEDFLNPISPLELCETDAFQDHQYGSTIAAFSEHYPDLTGVEIILLGVEDFRGGNYPLPSASADAVRKQFYLLYNWHPEIKMADIGNIKVGNTLRDTQAALGVVLDELLEHQKIILILGGSQDLILPQYREFVKRKKIIEATVVDALIDLSDDEDDLSRQYLLEMLTGEPNYVRHYTHIGFQSYFVHPGLLETLDKLRFDCYRLGMAQERMEEMEPSIRSSELFSFDINAIRSSDAPANRLSPNGFTGDEACTLFQFAGMSEKLIIAGIYNFIPELDRDELTAIELAQMIWYFINGRAIRHKESDRMNSSGYKKFMVLVENDIEATFFESKRTNRWWMQIKEGQFIPCTYSDYLTACEGELPERWLRIQERI